MLEVRNFFIKGVLIDRIGSVGRMREFIGMLL